MQHATHASSALGCDERTDVGSGSTAGLLQSHPVQTTRCMPSRTEQLCCSDTYPVNARNNSRGKAQSHGYNRARPVSPRHAVAREVRSRDGKALVAESHQAWPRRRGIASTRPGAAQPKCNRARYPPCGPEALPVLNFRRRLHYLGQSQQRRLADFHCECCAATT